MDEFALVSQVVDLSKLGEVFEKMDTLFPNVKPDPLDMKVSDALKISFATKLRRCENTLGAVVENRKLLRVHGWRRDDLRGEVEFTGLTFYHLIGLQLQEQLRVRAETFDFALRAFFSESRRSKVGEIQQEMESLVEDVHTSKERAESLGRSLKYHNEKRVLVVKLVLQKMNLSDRSSMKSSEKEALQELLDMEAYDSVLNELKRVEKVDAEVDNMLKKLPLMGVATPRGVDLEAVRLFIVEIDNLIGEVHGFLNVKRESISAILRSGTDTNRSASPPSQESGSWKKPLVSIFLLLCGSYVAHQLPEMEAPSLEQQPSMVKINRSPSLHQLRSPVNFNKDKLVCKRGDDKGTCSYPEPVLETAMVSVKEMHIHTFSKGVYNQCLELYKQPLIAVNAAVYILLEAMPYGARLKEIKNWEGLARFLNDPSVENLRPVNDAVVLFNAVADQLKQLIPDLYVIGTALTSVIYDGLHKVTPDYTASNKVLDFWANIEWPLRNETGSMDETLPQTIVSNSTTHTIADTDEMKLLVVIYIAVVAAMTAYIRELDPEPPYETTTPPVASTATPPLLPPSELWPLFLALVGDRMDLIGAVAETRGEVEKTLQECRGLIEKHSKRLDFLLGKETHRKEFERFEVYLKEDLPQELNYASGVRLQHLRSLGRFSLSVV